MNRSSSSLALEGGLLPRTKPLLPLGKTCRYASESGVHPSSTIQGWCTTPPPFLYPKQAPIYLWQILDDSNTTRPSPNLSARDPFSPSYSKRDEQVYEVTCTGSQDERLSRMSCCRQCPHSPVHSDPAHTPVVWDPVNTPKVTSLAFWQDSMQYVYDAFLPEKDSLWSHPPNSLPTFNLSSPCLTNQAGWLTHCSSCISLLFYFQILFSA